MCDVSKIRYRTKKVPPEGGFGIILVLGFSIPFGFLWGYITCVGLIYHDFIENVGGGTSSFTTIMGFQFISFSVSALLSGTLSKMTSKRTTALIGSILSLLGGGLTVFVTSVKDLCFIFGLLFGVGCGLMMPPAFGTFNDYFVKKRTFMLGISQCITSSVVMLYPITVNFLMRTYGFRGTLAVLAAINSNALVGMLLLHPVKWHYKTIQVPDDESQPFMNSDVNESGAEKDSNDNEKTLGMEAESNLEAIEEVSHEDKIDGDSNSMKIGDHHPSTEQVYKDSNSIQRRLSIATLCDVNQSTKNGKWQNIIALLDLSLLGDLIYLNIILGLTFAHFADHYFFSLQPMYLSELKISKDETAFIMSIVTAFDMGSRILYSTLSYFITFNARHTYLFGVLVSIILRFVYLSVFNLKGLLIGKTQFAVTICMSIDLKNILSIVSWTNILFKTVSAMMGIIKTFTHLPTNLILAEYLPREKFTSGYGLFMCFQGIFSFILGPFIGWIRDSTQSYAICFHTLSFIMGICAVSWLMEIAWIRFFPKKTKNIVEKCNEI